MLSMYNTLSLILWIYILTTTTTINLDAAGGGGLIIIGRAELNQYNQTPNCRFKWVQIC